MTSYGPVRWTDLRDTFVREHYPANMPMQTMLAHLNAMPGAPITPHQLENRANKVLGVYRSGKARPSPARPIDLENLIVPDAPLRPVPVRTRDGMVSSAWLDAAPSRESVPASLRDIEQWASQHAVAALEAADIVQATNAARRRFGLPPFRPVAKQLAPLPSAWRGGEDHRR